VGLAFYISNIKVFAPSVCPPLQLFLPAGLPLGKAAQWQLLARLAPRRLFGRPEVPEG